MTDRPPQFEHTQRPQISVVVCTVDRPQLLRQAVLSLARQSLPPEDFEVVVVDNGDLAATAEVCRDLQAELPSLRLVSEKRPGLSHARNRGAEDARAAWVAFIDDDATAEPEWLASLLAAVSSRLPAPGSVGGPVRATWGAPRPAWLSDGLLPMLSVFDWGAESVEVELPQFLSGTNFAVDRETLLALGGFNPALGRVGASLLAGEETELLHRFANAGLASLYVPDAVVNHLIEPTRLQKSHLRRRARWTGRSQVRALFAALPDHPMAAPRAVIELLALPTTLRQIFGSIFAADQARRFEHRCGLLIRFGVLSELLRPHR